MIVADSSSLIAFDRIGRFDLLAELYENEVLIPPAVTEEVLRGPHRFTAGHPAWLIERSPQDVALIRSLQQHLGAGESQAIVLALELGSDLLIDERRGRNVALSMGITITGTIGALLEAKRYSLIPSLSALIEELQAAGFFLSPSIVDEMLQQAGER